MKEMALFFVRAFPFTVGLVVTLTALSLLVSFTDSASLSNINDEDFIAFVLLSMVGIPTLLLGINNLSNANNN